MSFRSELARWIAGKAKEPAEALTRGSGGDAQKNPYARIGMNDKTDRRAKIKRFMSAYQRGGPYADALDSYHLFTLANGYKLVCSEGDELAREQVQTWCDQPHVNLTKYIRESILSAKLAGDGYQEILLTKDGKDIWGLVTRDPSTFEKVPDEYGRVKEYIQYIGDGTAGLEKPNPIPQVRLGNELFIPILNVVLDSIPGSVYGQSIWDRAEDNILQDCDIMESTAKAMHRHGTPKAHWQLGSEENRASDNDIKNFRQEVEQMDAKTDMITTHDAEYESMDTAGIPNVDVYSNVSLQRVTTAMGVPEEMMGLGRGSTEATAKVRMEAFMHRIRSIQKDVAEIYSRQLFDRITQRPGSVWMEFNEPPKDFAQIAEAISKLRSGIDPDAVIDGDESRGMIGLLPREEEPV